MTLTIDTKVYPLEAVQAAAYSMTDRVYARVARKGGEVVVTLKPKTEGNGSAALEDEFYNELLHQALRLKVSENNQKIREYIVTKALVSAQVPGLVAEAQGGAGGGPDPECPECAAEAKARQSSSPGSKEAGQPRQDGQQQAPPVDAELEKEIEKLLAEIEKAEPSSDDPLGVAVPWEQKHGLAPGRQAPGGEAGVPLAVGGGKARSGKTKKAGKAKARRKAA